VNNEGIIAYAGEITLDQVVWDNLWGQYIKLKLEQRPHEKTTANPFKKFTKMKKDRVGTRFSAVFTSEDASVFYEDEVMLKHWGDGVTGWTLHLWVNPDEDGFHPFMDEKNGAVFAIAMVELDDDNSAIDQVKREKLAQVPKGRRAQKLSNFAAQLCREPMFMRYLGDTYGIGADEETANEVATQWMREFLGIKSRSELDSDAAVADQFHADIRKPYAAWNSRRG
jgi:hypothetical protein